MLKYRLYVENTEFMLETNDLWCVEMDPPIWLPDVTDGPLSVCRKEHFRHRIIWKNMNSSWELLFYVENREFMLKTLDLCWNSYFCWKYHYFKLKIYSEQLCIEYISPCAPEKYVFIWFQISEFMLKTSLN